MYAEYSLAHAQRRLEERRTAAGQQRVAAAIRRERRTRRRIERGTAGRSKRTATHHRSKSLRHLLEMIAAMAVGMVLLGALTGWALPLVGLQVFETVPELAALLMAFNMTVGMTVWMRHRRHDWPSILAMDTAMFVPFIALFPAFWLDAISEDLMFMLAHVLMLPVMAAVMFSRRHNPVHI